MLVASGIESVNKNLNGSKPLMDHHQKMMKELASHYNYVTKQENYKDKLRKAFVFVELHVIQPIRRFDA